MTKTLNGKSLTKSPHHLLKRAAQHAANIYATSNGRAGLTQRQYTLLQAVDHNEGVSQSDLVRITGIDRSTLADLVARLMTQGYLQRRRTREDGRTNSVRLTASGRRMLKAAEPSAGDVDKQLLAAIPARYRKGFLEGLTILASLTDGEDAREARAA
ncbi:MAG: MarR family winged helix-turn-helix transcriptional regulator [Parvibaculaceae bacterium]